MAKSEFSKSAKKASKFQSIEALAPKKGEGDGNDVDVIDSNESGGEQASGLINVGDGNDVVVIDSNDSGGEQASGGSDEITGQAGTDRLPSDSGSDEGFDQPSQGKGGLLNPDLITNGGSVGAVEMSDRIDYWNFDAVNWFAKGDALAVEKDLQSQLGSMDPSDLLFPELKFPLFAAGTESLTSMF